MAVTPNYSIPYPALTDAPNEPAQLQAAVTLIDTVLLAIANKRTLVIARPAQTGFGSLGTGASATIATIVIPDPGWTYHIVTGGMVDYGATNVGDVMKGSINVGSAVLGTNSITQTHSTSRTAGVGNNQNMALVQDNSRVIQPAGYTGSQTLFLVFKNNSASNATVYNGPGLLGGDAYQWNIEVIPA